MRKLILISAFVLASVSAQAGQSRSLILASSDAPAIVETVKPAETAPATSQATPATTTSAAVASTETATTATAATTPTSTSTAATTTTETTKPARTHAAKSSKKTRWEADEAKARRIAAKYGVYW